MKYIITLKKVLEKKVVIDADDPKEADQKLDAGETAFEAERMLSADICGGWEYKGCISVEDNDAVICSLEDFARWFGCREVSELEHALYENTSCGMCYSADAQGITLVAYVEGVNCGHPKETLLYPFIGSYAKGVMRCLEAEVEGLGRTWNEEENI